MPIYRGDDVVATRNRKIHQPKDAIAMLKADHQKVRQLFQEYEVARDRETKQAVATLVFIELETHAQLEEIVFYPAVHEETEYGPGLVQDSLAEHETMKQLIQELREMGPDFKAFDAKFKELMIEVEHHVAEEENEMFPLAEEELAEDMQDMREEMQQLKEQILAS
jgi:hemerythrin-like domain-containing protein